ncbi:M28 family peptidase [Brevundimonas sp.]|uniref:M28 family peptidase n=1 Tax=Brevundimonas sp. TaxID=1871086 RepID=UPI0035B26530
MRLMSRVLATAALSALLAGGAFAQDFSEQRLSDGVRTISADEFQGRWPGSEGEDKTLAWLQAQYEAIGLEPGGPDGGWLQPVTLLRFTPTEPATVSWTGPGGAGGALEAGVDVTARTRGDAGSASIADAPLVFVGYGVNAPERNWDDFGDVDLTGKIAVVLGGEPDDERFRGEFPTLYGRADTKMDAVRRRGALAMLTVSGFDAADQRWRRGAGVSRPRTTIAGEVESVSLSMNRDAAGRLFAAAGQSLSQLTDRAESEAFVAVPLEGVTLSVQASETAERVETHNFIARLPGTDQAAETIVVSAHWDHVGTREPAEGQAADAHADLIFNGAWDNASGTVGVVELARSLKAAGPFERSLVFLHVTAEEQGLLGSEFYAANPVYPLETTVANVNIDMLPIGGTTRDLPIFGLGQNTLEDELQVLATAEGRTVTDDGQPQQGFYFRSDHFPFANAGVPALMPWHGVELDEGGREVGKPAYDALFRTIYHQPSDEWSADWTWGAAVETLTLMHRLVADLADSDRWPEWKADSEFASRRAESDAARQ